MALQLRNRGIDRVRPLVGGYAAWLKLGYATWVPGTPLEGALAIGGGTPFVESALVETGLAGTDGTVETTSSKSGAEKAALTNDGPASQIDVASDKVTPGLTSAQPAAPAALQSDGSTLNAAPAPEVDAPCACVADKPAPTD